MLRSVKDIRGYIIDAIDGSIGKAHDFYFDDEFWTIRYLVVDMGILLPGRRVLISPTALKRPCGTTHMRGSEDLFPMSLTKEQVKNSPRIDTDKPISRQHERELHEHYNWSIYWDSEDENSDIKQEEGDSHLRSMNEVMGYHIQAKDGEIGHVDDFIVDDETWAIRYFVVNTQNWLPGESVLVSLEWIEEVDWSEAKVYVDLTRENVKDSPKFDPSAPVNREYEERLYDYYGQPKD